MKQYAFRFVFWLTVIACLTVAFGACATESIGKPSALIGGTAAAGTAAIVATVWTAGAAFLVGTAVAWLTLMFSKTQPVANMPIEHGLPWFWIALAALLWFKGHHLLDMLTRKGGWNSLLKLFAFKRDRAVKP